MRQIAKSFCFSLPILALVFAEPVLADATQDEAVKQCDNLAAAVDDATKPAGIVGVEMVDLDGKSAVAYCEKAVVAFPGDLRLVFQLGRAQQAEGSAGEQAIANYRKAAEAGHAVAMNHLGYAYENGIGVAADLTAATQWYQKSAEAGVARAQRNLGLSYREGAGIERDAAKAMQWFMKSADQGNAAAMNYVGIMHEEGSGVKQDYAMAAAWYEKAAKLGDLDGIANLGLLYDEGNGVVQDQAKAVTLYQKAADAENAGAIDSLGTAYERGIGGLAKDSKKASELYLKAANLGDDIAMGHYGESLLNGEGVEKNISAGLQWYNKALEAGSEEAAFDLAAMHVKGEHVTADPAKAAELFVTALEGFSSEARDTLIANKGKDLPPDVINALQDKLVARGASFAKTDGVLNPDAIAYMEKILSGR